MNSKISSSEVSKLPSSKGVFGSRSKYAGNSLMESFASTLDSKKSIFDEQPTQNEEEDNKNDKDTVEEEVPLEAGTNTLLQEIEGRNINNNNNSNNNYNYNNNNNSFLIILINLGKIICMDGKTWKERGVGILKLNYPISNEKSPRIEAGTNTLLQEIEGRNINNNNNSNNNYNYNNNNNSFLIILINLVFTGEENETAQHSTRAKLFCMDGKTWKERGVGILKLNYPISNEKSPRIVMRADNVLKVILNVALFHRMHIERSQEKFIRLFAFEGDQLVHLAIKLPNINAVDGLFKAITDAIPSAKNQSHLVVSEESRGKKRKVEDLEEGDDDDDGPGGQKRNKMSIEFLLN
ncbi:hypothetical protein Glove_29g175 [Diversispora epigaea]|uniref:RanBD1 domain-containing protein n=1 Tax=Diversispora epigaea TaxID=1348612 RepID=A0A397JRR1_9GLOM|nr:hypothetical protein Glove_29g175 [Diversispora epigaea]